MSPVEPSVTSIIAMAAGFAAVLSLIVSYASYRISRKSFSLAERTAKSSAAKSTEYLIDAFRYRPTDDDYSLYVFCISIKNQSMMQNSVVNVEMRLPYSRDGVERLAIFSPANRLAKSDSVQIKNIIQLPASILARGGLIANCCFEVPKELLVGSAYDLHILRIYYADGPFSELKPALILDVTDVQDLEKKRKTGVPI